jgi:hypothetical protein
MKRRSNYVPAPPDSFVRLDMFDRAMRNVNLLELEDRREAAAS